MRRPVETKPFFLTSEFVVTLLAIIALGITAGVMDIVNARLTWILIASLVFGYVVSRGLAKAATKSHAVDPREELLRGDDSAARQDVRSGPRSYGPWGVLGEHFARAQRPLETKPFFLTSEFLGTALAILSVAITAAAMPNLGARLTWILIAAMVVTYAVSRGIAKAGTRSYAFDPREGGDGRDVAEAPAARGVPAIETKPFLLTSEFLAITLAILAIAISAAAIDILDVRLTWILITAMVCGYVFSRGLAKIGVKSYSPDPREQLWERATR